MRDNFSEATKKLLADRAGRKCSNPYCRRTTIGPQLGDKGTVNIGEAAHIYAAWRLPTSTKRTEERS